MATWVTTYLIVSLTLPLLSHCNFTQRNLEKAKNNDKEILNGVKLKTLIFDQMPFFSKTKLPDGNFSYGGICYDLLVMLSQYYNCSFEMINMPSSEISKYGLEEALLRYIDNNTVDIVPYSFETTLDNLKHLANSLPFWSVDFNLLQPFPNEESRLRTVIRPFSATAWICLGISTFIFIAVTSIMLFLYNHNDSQPVPSNTIDEPEINRKNATFWKLFYTQVEYVLTIITNQGNTVLRINPSFRLVTAIWLLSMVVIINAYTGVMTALLSVPKLEKTIETLEELATNSRFKLTKESRSDLTSRILEATSGTYKILGDQLRNNPGQIFKDIPVLIDLVVNHDSVFPTSKLLNSLLIKEDTKIHGKCRMTASEKPLPYFTPSYQVGYPKSSPYATTIDRDFISRLLASGIQVSIKKRYFPTTDQCSTVSTPISNTRKPIKFIDLTAAFALIIIGLTFSMVSFIIEIAWNIFVQSKTVFHNF